MRTHHTRQHPTIAALAPFPGESITDFCARADLFRTRAHRRAVQIERFTFLCAGICLILAVLVLHFYHVANY